MEIEIPSPSVFLKKSPLLTAVPAPAPKKAVKPRNPSKTKQITKDGAVTKPKQSKSRNGCMTCKKKRLKCDETKPFCVQCQKRNVSCEGYKKDFKWRSFEETTFNTKIAAKRRKSNEEGAKKTKPQVEDGWSLDSAFASASHAFQDAAAPAVVSLSASFDPLPLPEIDGDASWVPPKMNMPSPGSAFDLVSSPRARDANTLSPSFTNSPTLRDLLLPGTNMDQPPDVSEERPPMSPAPYQPAPFMDSNEDEVDEEVVRDASQWRQPSEAPSEAHSLVSNSSELSLLSKPRFDLSSPEMLLLRFDQNTCGILSVKDGPTENPWRTLVWPLAQDSPALYHALSSMTAFHGALQHPRLRLAGVAHMHKSIKRMAAEIGNMNLDSALATSLALALGEGWDEKTSTGIQHLRGAKIMVDNALVKYRQESRLGRMSAGDAHRLAFLCHTFVYLDVIARLTSTEESHDLNFEEILTTVSPPGNLMEVDPLMGCASSLFPLIGRVANLIQRARKTDTNSLNVISQANELQQRLLQWHAPDASIFARPEDPSSEVEHSVQTAEAYRFATLLYLHQAVPELTSNNHVSMAQRVLVLLASVPLSSRTVIVQIFPLFAASCEVTAQEDRAWVTDRWAAMMARLSIGNVESCWKVVQEVWRRRDEYEAEKVYRLMRFPSLPRRSTVTDIPLGQIEPEYTVRGRLHWIGVMSEWRWEVFLG